MPKLPTDGGKFALTPTQSRGILALMSGKSITEAAEAAGVTTRSIYKWLDIPDFRQALRAAQAGFIEHAQTRLVSGQQTALATLETLMTSAQSESVRRAAAVDWLGMLFKYREQGEFEDRLAALEKAVTNVQ